MPNQPGKPTVRNVRPHTVLRAEDMNRIISALVQQITGGDGIQIKTFGSRIVVSLVEARANPVTATHMTIASMEDQYLVCSWNGQTVNVAKPWGLRKEAAWPSGPTYEYDTASHRTATSGVDEESQYITPDWKVGETILARRIANSGVTDDEGNSIRWIDTNNGGRCWATY